MTYIAFFRGLNVGGRNRVKMSDLKRLFLDCGFCNVTTCLQSGNVLFESDQDRRSTHDNIVRAFAERFGFQSPVSLRTDDELSKIIAALPFTKKEIEQAEANAPEIAHIYLFLSNNNIAPALAETLRSADPGEDRFYVGKREIYLLCAHGLRDSKLAALAQKSDACLTFRNWKTTQRIHELLHAD